MSIYMMPVDVRKNLESLRNKFFIGSDQDEKKITWLKWKRCLRSKKHGGLGIGSIFKLNIRILFKWIWRFLSRPSDLWARVIHNIYGLCGGDTRGLVLNHPSSMPCKLLSEMFLSRINEILSNGRLMFLLGILLRQLNLNKLPSRVNLDIKGIDVGSILCPICHGDVEMVNHTFFNRGMAKDLWVLLAN
ncbi:hypothetical protein Tco_0404896 [Tanacetum coccineum]